VQADEVIWYDDFDNYTALPTDKYDFKYGDFSLVDLGGGNKAIYQAEEYTGEAYAMIPKGLVINSKNFEIIFRGRIDIWSGIGVAIGNSSTVWTSWGQCGNEYVSFGSNGYSLSYPPYVRGWARGYVPDYPPPPQPVSGEIPDGLFSMWNGVVRYTGDIGSYSDWRWIRVVSNETNLSIYYGGMEENTQLEVYVFNTSRRWK